MNSQKIYRVIDANINRLKEGVRVVEDIFRFVFDDKEIAKSLKTVRHSATLKNQQTYLEFRNIKKDILKASLKIENPRKNISDIIFANLKRAEESARVLEEVFKLVEMEESEKFKSIRYSLYNIEIEISKKCLKAKSE